MFQLRIQVNVSFSVGMRRASPVFQVRPESVQIRSIAGFDTFTCTLAGQTGWGLNYTI